MKTGIPVTPAMGNVHTELGAAWDRQTNRRTGKTCTAAY